MTDDGFRDSDLELRAQREGKTLDEVRAEGYTPALSYRRCPDCHGQAVELVYACGSRSKLEAPQRIRTTPCGRKRPQTPEQPGFPLDPKGGPR